ncbi:unnamed protein product [Dibothriocephalus latus]|uniref:UspA domain-containing protein n=1 Tax=Dibothriocephalus latus TaxID=60516 RepID=A0A3P7M017_DIBLA|nr:unnamed protein product [Dibothriocephalus latus]
MREQLVEGQQLTQLFSCRCREFNIRHKISIRADTEPAKSVLDVVEQYKANLVIMGCRGTDKVRRTRLGGVSGSVLHHCPVPVMLVPHRVSKKLQPLQAPTESSAPLPLED